MSELIGTLWNHPHGAAFMVVSVLVVIAIVKIKKTIRGGR